MHRGLYVVFEIVDGVGKTTQTNLYFERVKGFGIPAKLYREPGGGAYGEGIREILKDPDVPMTTQTEALLFASVRAELSIDIRKDLDEGIWVVQDRSKYSSLVYQGYGRGLDVENLEWIQNFALGGLEPDLVFLLHLDEKVRLKRKSKADPDRFEQELNMEKLAQFYLELAAKHENFRVIDASATVEVVHHQIWQHVKPHINERIGYG